MYLVDMEEQEIKRLLELEKPVGGADWVKLKWLYKNTFGKDYPSKCACNAHNLIKSVRKAKGYAN